MVQGKESYDIRTILDEMREEYWQGLSEVEDVQGEHLECVTFTLGGEIYAFETTHASEVIRVPKLVKVPRVPEMIVGVFNLRGEITAAIDFRPFLGLPQPPLTSAGRIIVVRSERFSTGILTEGVRGVQAIDLGGFEPAVRTGESAHHEYIRGQVHADGGLVMLLDIARLLAAPELVVGG